MSDALPGADPAQDRWTLSWKEAAAAQETGWGSLSESLEDVRAGLCRGKGGSKESERCVPRVRKPARAGQVINAQQKLCGRESIYSCNGLSLNTAAAQRGADALGCARAWAPCSGGPAGGSDTTPPRAASSSTFPWRVLCWWKSCTPVLPRPGAGGPWPRARAPGFYILCNC